MRWYLKLRRLTRVSLKRECLKLRPKVAVGWVSPAVLPSEVRPAQCRPLLAPPRQVAAMDRPRAWRRQAASVQER